MWTGIPISYSSSASSVGVGDLSFKEVRGPLMVECTPQHCKWCGALNGGSNSFEA